MYRSILRVTGLLQWEVTKPTNLIESTVQFLSIALICNAVSSAEVRPTSRLIIHKCCVNLCGYLWIFVDIDGDICGQLEDTRGSLWIFVDLCGYSIQSYLHAGRPSQI